MNFKIWGMSGSLTTQVVTDEAFAEERLNYWLHQIDQTCNRFSAESEISLINARGGPTAISPTLRDALIAAAHAYEVSDGLCDPTVLRALENWGYRGDFDELASLTNLEPLEASQPAPGLPALHFDPLTNTVNPDDGLLIDLGATAKALVCDRVVADLAHRGGVVCEIGGDVAISGRGPDGPWVIAVADRLELTGREPRIAMSHGGVATSSINVRRWRSGHRDVHHIIDPRTGEPAQGVFATATVSADDCVTANAFATAALIWGEQAPLHIAQAGWSARLVQLDGTVELVGGWPREEMAC